VLAPYRLEQEMSQPELNRWHGVIDTVQLRRPAAHSGLEWAGWRRGFK